MMISRKDVPLYVMVADFQFLPALDINRALCTFLKPVGGVVFRPVKEFLDPGKSHRCGGSSRPGLSEVRAPAVARDRLAVPDARPEGRVVEQRVARVPDDADVDVIAGTLLAS